MLDNALAMVDNVVSMKLGRYAEGINEEKRKSCPLLSGRGQLRLSKKSFRPKDSEGRIVGKGTVRVPFP